MERTLGTIGLADYCSQRRMKKATKLDGLSTVVDWRPLEKMLRKALGRDNRLTPGAKSYPALLMFKVLLLQAWYELSDEAMEEALVDRASFCRFVGLSLEDEVPDHTTICRFRNLLANKGVLRKLLDAINRQLEKQGKLVKKGIAVDASVISSAARPRKVLEIEAVPEDRKECPEDQGVSQVNVTYSHDTDAAWLKKGKDFHYGYKLHAAVDTKDGFILGGHMTPANASDTGEFKRLVGEVNLPKRSRVHADKGYTSKGNSNFLEEQQLLDGIMDRAWRNTPLSRREQQRNREISKKRYIVERVFGTLKRSYGFARASYIGLAKTQSEFLLTAIAYNLKRALFVLAPQGA